MELAEKANVTSSKKTKNTSVCVYEYQIPKVKIKVGKTVKEFEIPHKLLYKSYGFSNMSNIVARVCLSHLIDV